MNLLMDWAKQPPQLRLGLVSSVGVVISILCAEIVGVLGTHPGTALIAPVTAALSLGVVAAYCWFASDDAQLTTEPWPALRRARNGLAGGLVVLLAVTVAASFPGERVGLPTGLHFPLAIVVALIAVAFACVAIAFVRREQAFFTSQSGADPGLGFAATTASIHPPLEGTRVGHGLVAGVAVSATLVLFAAGASAYLFPLAALVLIPSVATWVYAALRLSRLDRRPLPKPSSDWPPRPFRVARFVSAVFLVLVLVGVLWWVWLNVDNWGLGGVDLAAGENEATVVLLASAIVGLVAAVAYPFFTIAEALRTPTKEPAEGEGDAGVGAEDEPLPVWMIETARSRAPGRDPL